jgi:hypothetical protein
VARRRSSALVEAGLAVGVAAAVTVAFPVLYASA